jgi:hypothetical protein
MARIASGSVIAAKTLMCFPHEQRRASMPNTRLRSSAHESLRIRHGERWNSNWTSELCGAGGSRGSEDPASPVVGASPLCFPSAEVGHLGDVS